MKNLRRTTILIAICAASVVAGCAGKPWMMSKTTLTPKPIALVEGRYIDKKPLPEMTSADIAKAAKTYTRTGAGPLYVVVAHAENAKDVVTDRTKDIAAALEAQGVAPGDIVASTVPLTTAAPVVLIAFDTLEATKPEGCTNIMPGMNGTPTGTPADFKYNLGCTVKENIAKQVARTGDLKGVSGLGGENDGTRAANVVNGTIKAGTPRAFLPSYVISELAGGGG